MVLRGAAFALRVHLQDTPFYATNDFMSHSVCLGMILRVNCVIRDPTSPPARLFFRTGFARPSRTSKCSNRIEITRVARKKKARWPRVPLLA